MQLQCRHFRNDRKTLETKDKIYFYRFLEAMKNSAKSVTVAQQKRHLAQFSGASASGTARSRETFNIQRPTSNIELKTWTLGVEC
jgi:hypothetical protein